MQLRPAGYNRFPQTTNSYAAYTQFNYQLLPTVEVDFGARRTWDRKSATYTGTVVNPIAGAALLANETTPLRYSNNNWSFRGTVSWHATRDVLGFVTYSSGYKSGGFNASAATAVLGAGNRTFNAETVRDLEVGVKSVFLGGKSLLNATFFNTILDNSRTAAITACTSSRANRAMCGRAGWMSMVSFLPSRTSA